VAEEVASRRLVGISMRGRLLSLKVLKRDPNAPKEAPKVRQICYVMRWESSKDNQFMGFGLCESFNKQTALANAHGQATSDSKEIGDHVKVRRHQGMSA
ncbi:hypothetical protein EV363DRAFT_1348006, partial [Boletus edulis]